MQNPKCPKCGHKAPADTTCPACGHAASNGTAARPRPTPPPEVATWVIEPVPPEIREHFLRTFNEEEFLAEMREAMKTGGANIDGLIETSCEISAGIAPRIVRPRHCEEIAKALARRRMRVIPGWFLRKV